MQKLLIVIPAHNEEASIVPVVRDLIENYPQYDYVVVNDGSRDKTAALCRQNGFHLIDLPVNLGLAGRFRPGCATPPSMTTTAPCRWTPMGSTSRNTLPKCWLRWRKATISSSAAAF